MYTDTTSDEIDLMIQESWNAFLLFRNLPLKTRAGFMRLVATNLSAAGDTLIETANVETHLGLPRLRQELSRTIFQLNSYADFSESGQWLEASIDTPVPGKLTRKDIRRLLVPLGPVAVFGASNFPFAYSTAGGDTACAFAAGCPVIVKAHPSHPETSERVAEIITQTILSSGMPKGLFCHIHGSTPATSETIVKHPLVKAVGFTGSFVAGKQLFDWGNERKVPIPVFAEMSSVNPVFLFPEKLNTDAKDMAKAFASSITTSSGQFCTNPGILIGIIGPSLEQFIHFLEEEIKQVPPSRMLSPSIFKNYVEKRVAVLSQKEVNQLAVSETPAEIYEGSPTLATVSAAEFIENPILQKEVFGPFSLLVKCNGMEEMIKVAKYLDGQLTASIICTENEIVKNNELIDCIKNLAGRIVMNDVPTGVQVGLSMQHGGPFPATTDSRFTSVGAYGIKRFARPMSFQNWPDSLLPDELKNSNPLDIWRTVNNELTKTKLLNI